MASFEDTSISVAHDIALELVDPAGEGWIVGAEFRYSSADPYAVTLAFDTARGMVSWTFARELLAEGVLEPTGDGDVQVWPSLSVQGRAVAVIELSSPDGLAMLQAQSGDLLWFLAETDRLVEPGSEPDHLDVDAAIRALLDAPPSSIPEVVGEVWITLEDNDSE
jgi:hypothetical protein